MCRGLSATGRLGLPSVWTGHYDIGGASFLTPRHAAGMLGAFAAGWAPPALTVAGECIVTRTALTGTWLRLLVNKRRTVIAMMATKLNAQGRQPLAQAHGRLLS